MTHDEPSATAGRLLRERPESPTSVVRLADGSDLTVRAIHRSDGPLLLEHFDHLGKSARYRRFLGAVDHLTTGQLDYFTHPDHHLHEALFALDEDGHPVGVARYIASPEHATSAELAVAVVDGWRGRGVGGVLVDELARRARRSGITQFFAFMLSDNLAMRSILARLGPVGVLSADSTAIELAVPLRPSRGRALSGSPAHHGDERRSRAGPQEARALPQVSAGAGGGPAAALNALDPRPARGGR